MIYVLAALLSLFTAGVLAFAGVLWHMSRRADDTIRLDDPTMRAEYNETVDRR